MTEKIRTGLQAAAALIQNANFKGFFSGSIYQGDMKRFCVPGLNCYSCPGALGACPIGSLQNSLSSLSVKFPYYVLGLMIFFGAVLGRAVCGFLCPFGFVQDMLFKIPFVRKLRSFRGDRTLRRLKYAVLIFMVIALPLFIKLTPVFCKYLCPSGTLSGILLALSDNSLFALMGGRFAWKACILGIMAAGSIIIYRPFCKYLCPLGAFYAPFNKAALLHIRLDKDICTGCKSCAGLCDMGVDPSLDPDSAECIRCGKCVAGCPADALKFSLGAHK